MSTSPSSGAPDTVRVQRDVEYVVHDGVSLRGHLYRPSAPGRYPAVVAVHGGGWQNGATDNYQYWGPWLAARGYVVFAPTYRLSRLGVKSYPEAVQDVRAAVQFVRGNAGALEVDPDRIAVMGDSAGAHLTTLVALAGEHPLFRDGNAGDPHGAVSTRVKVAIPVYGVFDLVAQWEHDLVTRTGDPIAEKFVGVSLLEERRAYFDASPLSYVSSRDNGTAFLVVWSTGDDIVDFRTQSEVFLRALKRARHFVRPVIVPGAPHFWCADPIDEAGSHTAYLAPRLLRFLAARL